MGKSNPSARSYPIPTYSTTPITARETFGGPAKAGLGRHIGMGPWTFGAIVNGSSGRSGHAAPPFAGMNFPAAFLAGKLPTLQYPISKTNQLARIGVGTTGGMTRTPADGVNRQQRANMQLRTDNWNLYWPARPIRDTPNKCCYVDPVGKLSGVEGPLIVAGMLIYKNATWTFEETSNRKLNFTSRKSNGILKNFLNITSKSNNISERGTRNIEGIWDTLQKPKVVVLADKEPNGLEFLSYSEWLEFFRKSIEEGGSGEDADQFRLGVINGNIPSYFYINADGLGREALLKVAASH